MIGQSSNMNPHMHQKRVVHWSISVDRRGKTYQYLKEAQGMSGHLHQVSILQTYVHGAYVFTFIVFFHMMFQYFYKNTSIGGGFRFCLVGWGESIFNVILVEDFKECRFANFMLLPSLSVMHDIYELRDLLIMPKKETL